MALASGRRVRVLSADDAGRVLELRRAVDESDGRVLGPPFMRGLALQAPLVNSELRDPDGAAFGVDDAEGSLLGCAMFKATPMLPSWYGIGGVIVARIARGAGIGRALVNACLDRARELDAIGVCIDVNSPNPFAETLYRSLGFEEWSRSAAAYRYDGQAFDQVSLRYRLRSA